MARTRTAPTTPTTPTAAASQDNDLLKGAARKATKAQPKTKTELPTKKVSPETEKEVSDLIRLATIEGEFSPLVKQYKGSVGQKLLDLWVKEMWATKKVPSNYRVPVMKKDDAGRDTLKKDMDTTFQVKFRADGLSKIVPDADELPEGVSVEDKLHEALVSEQVGLSEDNADKLLNPDNGDITVQQMVMLSDDFNKLYSSTDEATKSGATKLLKYLQATASRRGQKTVELPLFSDEESAAVLTTKQVVILKEGFFERATLYVRSEEELGRLIRFVTPTLQLGSFEFGVSDKKSERVERLSNTVEEFLSVGGEE